MGKTFITDGVKSLQSSSYSNRFMALDKAPAVMFSCSAARTIVPASITVLNCKIRLVSIMQLLLHKTAFLSKDVSVTLFQRRFYENNKNYVDDYC